MVKACRTVKERGFETLCRGPVPWEPHGSRDQGTHTSRPDTEPLRRNSRLSTAPANLGKAPEPAGGTGGAEAEPSVQGAASQGTERVPHRAGPRPTHVLGGRQLDGISGDIPTLTSHLSRLRSFYCCESFR